MQRLAIAIFVLLIALAFFYIWAGSRSTESIGAVLPAYRSRCFLALFGFEDLLAAVKPEIADPTSNGRIGRN